MTETFKDRGMGWCELLGVVRAAVRAVGASSAAGLAGVLLCGFIAAPAAHAGKTALRSYFAVPHNAELRPIGAITLEAWVRPRTEVRTRCGAIASKNMSTSYWFGICKGYLTMSTHGPHTQVQSEGKVSMHEWSHVAVTFDGVWHRFYINGTLDSAVKAPGYIGDNITSLMIGGDTRMSDCANDCRVGVLAEVRLWNEARSQAAIRNYINVHIASPVSSLVAAWPLDRHIDDVIGGRSGLPVGPYFEERYAGSELDAYARHGGSPPVSMEEQEISSRYQGTAPMPSSCGFFPSYPDKKPIWIDGEQRAADLYMAAEDDFVEICVEGIDPKDDVVVYVDPTADGGTYARHDDYRAVLSRTQGLRVETGNGAGGFNPMWGTMGITARYIYNPGYVGLEPGWQGQFRIPRSRLAQGWNGAFGLQVIVDTDASDLASGDWGWPAGGKWNRPSTYQSVTLDDTSPDTIRPDLAWSEHVFLSEVPGWHIVRATAFDYSYWRGFSEGLEQITIELDGERVADCHFDYDEDDWQGDDETCQRGYFQLFTVGHHVLDIAAHDFAGNSDTRTVPFIFKADGSFVFPNGPYWNE